MSELVTNLAVWITVTRLWLSVELNRIYSVAGKEAVSFINGTATKASLNVPQAK
jgi:hypothetical protein